MEQNRYAVVTDSLTRLPSRREVLRGLTTAGLAWGTARLPESALAKKRRRKKRKPKPQAPTCRDGRKNGGETDVDCGGTCPRCGLGRTCASRNDCATALCVDRVCAEPVSQQECGQDTGGGNCATRTNAAGLKICTKIDGRFFATGTCAQHCLATEQCVLPTSGGVECVLPCGAPDA